LFHICSLAASAIAASNTVPLAGFRVKINMFIERGATLVDAR
jgi:hypothetical protein